MTGVFSRCEEVIDLEEETSSVLYVNSVLNPETLAEVRVNTANSKVTNDEADFVTDALVEIYGIGSDPEATLIYQEGTNGIYRAEEYFPRPGRIHQVRVYTNKYGSQNAESYVPHPSQITSLISNNLVIVDDGDDKIYSFNLEIEYEDVADEQNYYHLRLFQGRDEFIVGSNEDTIVLETTIELIEFPSPFSNEYRLADGKNGILFTDNAVNGGYVFSLSSRINPESELFGQIYTELRTVSSEYYSHQISIANSSVNHNGGLTQPGSGYGNVKNGAGAVTGYSGTLDTIDIN